MKISKSLLKKILNNKANKILNIFFVGVGGISMSSLAIFALNQGHKVSGSDINNTEIIKMLKQKGVIIYNSHDPINVKGVDVVVYSNAVENSREVLYAKQNKILTVSRAEFLAIVLSRYKLNICVAGSHGKTTTTALIYSILKESGYNPNLHLGGILKQTNKSYEYNNSNIMVCEACEYKNSFLKLPTNIAVVTNVRAEHLDYFKTFKNVKKSFNKFLNKASIKITEKDVEYCNKTLSYGFGGSVFMAKNIKLNSDGTYKFDVYYNNNFYVKIKLNLIGLHNVLNALASICVAHCLHINKKHIQKALKSFNGIKRRYEHMHSKYFIVHDYAHHPDEINAVIKETQKFYKGKLLVIFQPHTYSRTKTLFSDFVNCLKNIKDVVIFKTYSARERYNVKGSAKTLSKAIKNSVYINNKQKLINHVVEKIKNGYGVLLLGAGDIDLLAKKIAKSVDNRVIM